MPAATTPTTCVDVATIDDDDDDLNVYIIYLVSVLPPLVYKIEYKLIKMNIE